MSDDEPDLFSFSARDAKREAMDRVDRNANEEWKAAAERALLRAARELPELTADDVVDRMPPEAQTHEWRALGPVMTRGAKWGWTEKTGRSKNSKRVNCHAKPLTIWRSLLR